MEGKMKKILLTLFLPLLFSHSLFITSCSNRSSPSGPPPHQEGTYIVATSDGVGVTICWEPVTDVTHYVLITPDNDTLSSGSHTWCTDPDPSSTGMYYIYSLSGPVRVALDSISSAPICSDSTLHLYRFDSEEGFNGFGWDTTTGRGILYTCDESTDDSIDIFLDTLDYRLHLFSCDESPYCGSKRTYIQFIDTTDFFTAPESLHTTSAYATYYNYYALKVEGGYYAKIHITNTACNTLIAFEFEFQRIKGLRIF
jgi:hypothetical protein